jgi:hypothetical protein
MCKILRMHPADTADPRMTGEAPAPLGPAGLTGRHIDDLYPANPRLHTMIHSGQTRGGGECHTRPFFSLSYISV